MKYNLFGDFGHNQNYIKISKINDPFSFNFCFEDELFEDVFKKFL